MKQEKRARELAAIGAGSASMVVYMGTHSSGVDDGWFLPQPAGFPSILAGGLAGSCGVGARQSGWGRLGHSLAPQPTRTWSVPRRDRLSLPILSCPRKSHPIDDASRAELGKRPPIKRAKDHTIQCTLHWAPTNWRLGVTVELVEIVVDFLQPCHQRR